MNRICAFTLVLIAGLAPFSQADAGIFNSGIIFGKKKKGPVVPAKRVPELIKTIRESTDAHQREDAIEELREFDHEEFPGIVAVLVEVLTNDVRSSVRVEAVRSIGRMRPISTFGGRALEKALDKDSSIRVRLQARSALLQYRWRGYRSGSGDPLEEPRPPIKNSDPANDPSRVNPPVIKTGGTQERDDPSIVPRIGEAPSKGTDSPSGLRPLPVGPKPGGNAQNNQKGPDVPY